MSTTQTPSILDEVMIALPDDEKIHELIESRSQLYIGYSVRNKDGHFRQVVDIDSVVQLLRELLTK